MRSTVGLVGAAALLAACAGPLPPPTAAVPPSPTALTRPLPAGPLVGLQRNGGVAELRFEPVAPHGGDEQTPADHDPAWVAARAAAALGGPLPISEPRLVVLTVRPLDGRPVVLRDRRVWLVPFPGVPFDAAGCPCEGSASTLVVLDALHGTVVAAFGLAD